MNEPMKCTLSSRLNYTNTVLAIGFARVGNKPVARWNVKFRLEGLAHGQNLLPTFVFVLLNIFHI